MRRPLALRKVTPPAPGPVALEDVVYEVERLAGAAYVLSVHLGQEAEVEGKQAAELLTDGLERQAALLRLSMYRPDDSAEVSGEGRADG